MSFFEDNVTPFMGVWIEIQLNCDFSATAIVTPFMGVWIEIIFGSLAQLVRAVTPFMGVWIEIKTAPPSLA